MYEPKLSLAARPRLVTGQRRSDVPVSVNISNYMFFRQTETGGRESLDPCHCPTWVTPKHIQGFPCKLQEIWEVVSSKRRSKGSRQQVSKASALPRKWGGLAAREEGWKAHSCGISMTQETGDSQVWFIALHPNHLHLVAKPHGPVISLGFTALVPTNPFK